MDTKQIQAVEAFLGVVDGTEAKELNKIVQKLEGMLNTQYKSIQNYKEERAELAHIGVPLDEDDRDMLEKQAKVLQKATEVATKKNEKIKKLLAKSALNGKINPSLERKAKLAQEILNERIKIRTKTSELIKELGVYTPIIQGNIPTTNEIQTMQKAVASLSKTLDKESELCKDLKNRLIEIKKAASAAAPTEPTKSRPKLG